MKKVVIERPGGYERLKLRECADPGAPKPGHVLVRTEAIGVNYADVAVRWGLYESANKLKGYPITPGFEFAGRVEGVASGVKNFKPGDAVFGVSFFDSYATHVEVPEHQLFARPKQFSAAEAAAFPAVHLTAYHALFQNVVIRPGMNVLVHSAAGGVGTALLQLGKIAGLRMVAVVGASHKIQTAREFGADAVIDKSTADLWAEARKLSPGGYDLVLDANGVSTLRQSYEALAPTGKLLVYGFHSMLPRKGGKLNWPLLALNYLRSPRFNPIHMTSENRSLITFNLSFLFERRDLLAEGMQTLLGWVSEGRLARPKVTTYPLAEVARAHAALESAQTTGKLILLP